MALIDWFSSHMARLGLPPGRGLVAVSGGPDSVALLDLLVLSRESHRLDLVVAHADHGIHPDSGRVAGQVRDLAASYGLPVEVGRLELGPETGETSARAARYSWLETVRARRDCGVVFTAHHADDQVETVLMRVLAGSGPAGLAGMAALSGRVVRPLLSVSRAELLDHLVERELGAWLDPANADPRHLRSWIRTELLPTLRRRVAGIDENLLRLSRQAGRDKTAWDAVLDVLPELDYAVETDGISVAASSLAGYDSALAQAVILAAARRAGCQLGPARVGGVLALLKAGSSGATVSLGGGWTAELSFDRLRLWRDAAGAGCEPWQVAGHRGQGAWGRWAFRWESGVAPGRQSRSGTSAWFTFEALTVRGWSPGEKLRPLGGTGRRLIVRCFQEVRVPRSRRAAWPVLARNEEVIWIPGVCRSDALLPTQGTEALRIDAEYA